MNKQLKDLMNGIISAKDIPDINIAGLAYDSREVKPGYLFAALTGAQQDGHDYIPQAITNGATLIIGSKPLRDLSVPYIQTESPRNTLAVIAARYYGEPTRDIPVIGITGTNGKTTCSYIIESILSAAGYSPVVLGTINYRYREKVMPAPITTPEAVDLQRWIAEAKQDGADAVVMEVSSHGIAMDRVGACHIDEAIFTNLSQDHLDFHGTIENYFNTKVRLFTELLPSSKKPKKHAVLNWDDPYAHKLAPQVTVPLVRCSLKSDVDYGAYDENLDIDGIRATIQTPDGSFSIESPLTGYFNLQNILISVAACHGLGIPFAAIAEGIQNMSGVPGRLERVANDNQLRIFVDYAHTPDALRKVLEALKPFVREKSPHTPLSQRGDSKKGRLITVFGCGGDRDHEKRPLMGQAAASLSDVLCVTSDNPRTEDPQEIIDQILPGILTEKIPLYNEKSQRGYFIEPDRRKAIRKATEMATPDDLILIAGKGHEDYQILGTQKVHFDDREEAQKACEALV